MSDPPINSKECSNETENFGNEFAECWRHLSSLAQESDEKNKSNVLSNLLDNIRGNWQKSEAKCHEYKAQVASLEKKLKAAERDNSRLNDLLLNCQSQVKSLMKSKSNVEGQLEQHKRQLDQYKTLVKDGSFIDDKTTTILGTPQSRFSDSVRSNNNMINGYSAVKPDATATIEEGNESESESDTLYDKSGEETLESSFDVLSPVSRKANKRRSKDAKAFCNSVCPTTLKTIKEKDEIPTKRPRRSLIDDENLATTVKLNSKENKSPTDSYFGSKQRRFSESTILNDYIEAASMPSTPFQEARLSSYVKNWTNGQKIEKCRHRALPARFSMFTACDVCKKRFGAQNALRCKTCKIKFHDECEFYAPLPCVPRVTLPKVSSKEKLSLIHYCPSMRPFIPPLLIHCTIALERRHSDREGLYRIPGVESAVTKLYNEILTSSIIPSLDDFDADRLASCIKKFFQELEEPLIPSSIAKSFFETMKADDVDQFVVSLPAPNRDTLAFFLLHLKKIAENSAQNKMTIENLAKVLAPTLIGASDAQSTIKNMGKTMEDLYSMLLTLLRQPSDFWRSFIDDNTSNPEEFYDEIPRRVHSPHLPRLSLSSLSGLSTLLHRRKSITASPQTPKMLGISYKQHL